jgi:Domain of unknown function (DUF4177)
MRGSMIAGVVVVALGLAWFLGSSSAAPALKDSPRAKWEYKIVALKKIDKAEDWEKVLNELGAEGWEVVGTPETGVQAPAAGGAAMANFPGIRVILKRAK